MQSKHWLLIILALIFVLTACNIPTSDADAGAQATAVAATLTALQQSVPPTQTFIVLDTSTPISQPTETGAPSATPTPQNPLVLRATLCWMGPGAVYEVVSSLRKDERVTLLGRGGVSGWWVVDNPIYHDPCWVQESDLQLDPGYDTSNLKVFNPPPTPTHTPTPETPTPTSTP